MSTLALIGGCAGDWLYSVLSDIRRPYLKMLGDFGRKQGGCSQTALTYAPRLRSSCGKYML